MSNTLSNLLHTLARLAWDCVQIILVFVLAVLVGMMWLMRAVLPYVLRAACITFFVFGWLQGVVSVSVLYARLTDSVGALFVAAALGVGLIALPVFGLLTGGNVWSAFALAGMSGFVCAFLCAQAQTNSILEWLARGLPVALAASGLVYLAAKNKMRQRDVIGHAALPNSRSE